MIYYFLLIGYYRLFLHKYRRHIFHQKVSAGYQPYIENRGKDKGLCSGLPEFVDTGFRTQGNKLELFSVYWFFSRASC